MYRYIFVIGQSNLVGQTWANMFGTSLAWGFMLCQLARLFLQLNPLSRARSSVWEDIPKRKQFSGIPRSAHLKRSAVVYKYTQLSSMVLVYH